MNNAPYELTKYMALLRAADRYYQSAERIKPGRRPKKSELLLMPSSWRPLDTKQIKYRQAEQAYGKALEYLDDVWQSVCHLLDRGFIGWSESDVSQDPWGVPRPIGSKSRYRQT
jgi:hypothetical protein